MVKKFLRRSWDRYSKLGKSVKKNRKWRRPTGRHNKMREKRKGLPAVVSIGYRTEKLKRDRIFGEKISKVRNLNEIKDVNTERRIYLLRMGKRKKIEIAKKAKENGLEIINLNTKKILKKNERKNKLKEKRK